MRVMTGSLRCNGPVGVSTPGGFDWSLWWLPTPCVVSMLSVLEGGSGVGPREAHTRTSLCRMVSGC